MAHSSDTREEALSLYSRFGRDVAAQRTGLPKDTISRWVREADLPRGWARVPRNLELLNEASDCDAAYMAGVIDGEGSVSIHTSRGNANFRGDDSSRSWVLEVAVVNTDKALIDWCVARFGGNSDLRRRPPEKSYWKDVYRWRCSGIHAEKLLRRVRPWLIVKASQADLAFEFRSTCHNGRRPNADDIAKRQAIVDGLRVARDHRKDPAGAPA